MQRNHGDDLVSKPLTAFFAGSVAYKQAGDL
jgi:hypothetical protein